MRPLAAPLPRVDLVEHEPRVMRLTPDEVEVLQAHGTVLDLRLLGGGRVQVRPTSYVGSLSSGRRELRIHPKCPTASLFWMLGWAHGITRLQDQPTGHLEVDDLYEFLVLLLVEGVEALVQRGVHQGYQEREEDLAALRGRLRVEDHLRRPPGSAWQLPCRFDELTPDTLHNRIIRATLASLPPVRTPRLRRRVRRLATLFSFASPLPLGPAALAGLHYDRLTEHYRPVHGICRVLLEGRGLDHPAGSWPLGGFLLNMNQLFERFVGEWLRAHLPRDLTLDTQLRAHLDEGRQLLIQPDLTLRREGVPVLVADTKYKRTDKPRARRIVAPADAYQMVAYVRALGLHTAVLIYPDWVGPPEDHAIRDGSTRLVADGVDLGRPPDELGLQLQGLMERLAARAKVPLPGREPPSLRATG